MMNNPAEIRARALRYTETAEQALSTCPNRKDRIIALLELQQAIYQSSYKFTKQYPDATLEEIQRQFLQNAALYDLLISEVRDEIE